MASRYLKTQFDRRNMKPHQIASCYNKARYQKEQREEVLASHPSFLEFYKCRYCNYYHIGRGKP